MGILQCKSRIYLYWLAGTRSWRDNFRTIDWNILEANTTNLVVRRVANVSSEVEKVNEENSRIIWAYIQEAGDNLKGNLPPSRNHPSGRNPYAHVALCVKNKFGKSYKEVPDEKLLDVIEYIDYLVENPT